jgi:hypothetical protein
MARWRNLFHPVLFSQEPPRCVGDRYRVVTDLEDGHGPHPQRDPLACDAFLQELGFA